VQDEITRNVVTELAVKMTQGEWARRMMHASENYEAVDCYLRADKEITKFQKEANLRGRELLMKAVQLDPNYARAMAYLGYTYWYDVVFGWVKNPTESFQQAQVLAERAVAINEKDYLAHALLSRIYARKRKYEQSIAAGKQAVEVEPNNANAITILGYTMLFAGMPSEALALCKKAMRLSPYPPSYFHQLAGSASYLTGQHEAAIAQYRKVLSRQQRGGLARWARQWLIASYVELGREEEARAEANKFLEQDSKICIETLIEETKRYPFKEYTFLDRQVELLVKAGLPQTPPLPLPDKPSIAVLPFVNMSGDPEQEYISDGISEEIITALSKTPKLFVIARTSSFRYKGKEVDVRTVGRELGVRYILEGSVRKSEDRLRITAQLVDAKTGNPLWAERYDREFKDIFAIQDEITLKIVGALEVELTEGETARLVAKGTHNLKAYLSCLGALEHWRRWTREGNVSARRMAKEAIALDPEYARSYELLAATHMMDVWLQTTKSPEQSIKRAVQLAQKAIALDDDFAPAHGLLGFLYTQLRQHDKAIAEGRLAIALNPNGATSIGFLSGTLRYAGECEEAVQMAEKAIRLNPFPPAHYFTNLAHAYICTGRNEEAIAACIKARNLNPKNLFTHLSLAIAYNLSKREEEARAAAAEVLKINPKFSLERFAKTAQYKNQAYTDMLINALRKAGLR
jgi:TolB-like protein/tetratricopeptide (TPR) repeat protein